MSVYPYYFYKFYNWLFRCKVPVIPLILMVINRLLFGAYIPPSCTIGNNGKFSYGGSGVVIHSRVVIGKHCVIGTGVTVGGRGRHSREEGAPVIGDYVFIATGAKILGPVHVGNNAIIGANAVVINDVPSNAVVAGVPAQIIGHNDNREDYY